MVYHVILLNDVSNSLKGLINYIEGLDDITLEVITSGDEFHTYMQEKTVHLILANSQCKTIDPLDICTQIRAATPSQFMPFLYLNKKDDVKGTSRAYETGVTECISSPLVLDDLVVRMRSHLLRYQTLKKCLIQNERLAIIVATDPLTKVSNRMHLQTILIQSAKEYKRYKRIFSVVYFQIGEMQKINLLYGFKKGDKLLKDVAQAVFKILRQSDIIARWSGSDFVIFLPKTKLEDAELLVKKLNTQLIKEKFLKEYNTRITYGITQVKDDDSMSTLIDRSNKALIHSIRNRQTYSTSLTNIV